MFIYTRSHQETFANLVVRNGIQDIGFPRITYNQPHNQLIAHHAGQVNHPGRRLGGRATASTMEPLVDGWAHWAIYPAVESRALCHTVRLDVFYVVEQLC